MKANAADGITIGMIYVGPRDDFGWNQAHAVAAQALKSIPGVKVVEEENVPETVAVMQTMGSMIEVDGAKLLFPTSFGYFEPFMVDAAKKYPKVEFRHPTSLWDEETQRSRRLFLLSRPGALRERRRRRPVDQEEQDRLCRGEADLARAAQHQRLRDGREEG